VCRVLRMRGWASQDHGSINHHFDTRRRMPDALARRTGTPVDRGEDGEASDETFAKLPLESPSSFCWRFIGGEPQGFGGDSFLTAFYGSDCGMSQQGRYLTNGPFGACQNGSSEFGVLQIGRTPER